MRSLFAGLALLVGVVASANAQSQRTASSPHGAFAAPCAQCHRADGWKPLAITKEFKHPDRFPLEAAHAKVACATCHTRLDFTGVKPTCASCHRDFHQGELGAECATCHTTRSFLDIAPMRRRHQATNFPLTGRHAMADCRACHVPRAPGQLSFVNLSTTCSSCHLADYKKASSPPHVLPAFPTDCATCHTATAWNGANVNHNATRFPLTGAHATTACSSCHGDGVYKGKPTTCVSCHLAKYQATTTPAHAAVGFPTDCAGCHTTTTWLTSTWDHDATFFPISSGAHRTPCATCHTNPSNYAVFNCLGCHTKSSTDAQHQGRTGYVYASPNCYACHPRGRS